MCTFELMLKNTQWATGHTVYRAICVYRSTRATFFLSTHLCNRTEVQLVHVCLHKMYPQVFFEEEVLRVLAELNTIEITTIEITRITCACITTHDFPLSLNQAVPYAIYL